MSKRLFIVFLARAALTFGGGFVAMVLFGAAIGVDHGPILLIAFVMFCCLFSLIGGRFDRRRLFITLLIAIAIVSTGCAPANGANGPTIDDYRPGARPKAQIVQAGLPTGEPAAVVDATATPLPAAQLGSTTVNVTVNSDVNTGLMDVIAGGSLVFGVLGITILAIWIRNTRRTV